MAVIKLQIASPLINSIVKSYAQVFEASGRTLSRKIGAGAGLSAVADAFGEGGIGEGLGGEAVEGHSALALLRSLSSATQTQT